MFSIVPLAPATVIDGLAGNTTGTLDWHFDSAATTFDFLADGESLVLTYTVEVTDDSATGNDTNTNTVTITIGGTNDQPTISADTASIAETDARLTDSGTLNIGDLDTSDTVSAQVIDLQIDASAIANGNEIDPADLEAMFSIVPLAPATVIDGLAGNTTGTLDWHFDSAATTFDFLADGESLVLTYTVEVTDDSATGNDTNTNTVTITIGGTNDQPTISADTASIAETDARLTDSGTLNIGDLDTSDRSPLRSSTSKSTPRPSPTAMKLTLADLEAMFSIVIDLSLPRRSSMDSPATPQALSTGTSTALPPPSTSSQTANLSSSLTPLKSPMTPQLATTQTPIPSPSPSVAPTISPPSPLIPPPSRKPTLD